MIRIASLRLSYAASLRLGLGLSAVASSLEVARGDTTWTGASSQNWSLAGNWNNGIPLDASNNGSAIINTSTGNYPIISGPAAGTDWDIIVANAGTTTGRLDHTAGTAATGNNNWMFVGNGGSSVGTYNLADTAGTGGTLTGFGQGSGSMSVGGTGTGRLTLGNGGTSQGTLNMNTSGTLTTTLSGLGLLVGTNGGSGTINLDNGTINTSQSWFGDNNAASVGTLNMSGGTINATQNTIFGQTGKGVATITGGNFNQNSGEFWVGSVGAAGGGSSITQSGGIVSTASYFVIGRGTSGSVTTSGSYSLSGGTVNAATGGGLTAIGSSRGATGTLSVSGTGTFNSNSGIYVGEGWQGSSGTATGTVNVSGGGLVSTGTNTATGLTLGVQANSTGTVNLNGGTIQTAIVKKGSGSGTFNFNGGTLKATASSATFLQGLTAANVQAGGAVIDSNGFNVTVGQALLAGTGSGGLVKNGSGTLTLSGTNTYVGGAMVNAGTLTVGNNSALGTGTTTLNGGTLSSANIASGFEPTITNAITVNAVSGNAIAAGTGTLFRVNGNISGSGALGLSGIFNGAGLRLAGDNSGYTGTATVTAANTRLGSSTAGSAGAAWVVNGNLQTDVVGGATFQLGSLSGTGNISGHANNASAAVSTLSVGALNTSTVFDGTIIDNAQNNAATGNSDGAQNNVLAVTKVGTGTLTLGGTNTYTGATTITGGTLALAATGSIDNTSGVSLGSGGTFDVSAKTGGYTVNTLTGSGDVIGSLTVSSLLSIGNSPGTTSFDNLTIGAGATYLFEFDGGGSAADLGNVSGTLAITDGAVLDLSLYSGSYTAGDKFTLFGYTSGSLSGLFRDVATNQLLDGSVFTDAGGSWMIDYDDTDSGINGGVGDRFVTVTAVPEPAIAALGGLGLLTLLRRRRHA